MSTIQSTYNKQINTEINFTQAIVKKTDASKSAS